MDIAGFWYRQARALRDPFDRLMAAYLAFTYLHIGGRKPKESERGCAARYAVDMCVLHSFDPFSCDVSEYRAGPVQSTRPGHEGEQFGLTEGDETPSELFSAIHQVRSNLFNGSSFFLDDRAPRLARQGADVLIGLLSRILS